MIKKKNRAASEVNASSMADIAFLLLIFFIITTNAVQSSGVQMILPILQEPQEVEIVDKNVCMILMSPSNKLLVEKQEMDVSKVRAFVKTFILNGGRNPEMSESPEEALVVLRMSRGANYESYIKVLNEIQQAYFELWADKAGVSTKELISWDVEKDTQLSERLDALRDVIPYNFSVSKIKE